MLAPRWKSSAEKLDAGPIWRTLPPRGSDAGTDEFARFEQSYSQQKSADREQGYVRMSKVRVLVGTRKGAFVLTSDGARKKWDVEGPHFAGWEIYHVKGSPANPDRLYASQSSGWFGQVLQRSNDGGKTWEAAGNQFQYASTPGTHTWYDGSPHPWEFKRVWHLEPSLTEADTVFAGVEDAALFKSTDGATTWSELPGLRTQETGPSW